MAAECQSLIIITNPVFLKVFFLGGGGGVILAVGFDVGHLHQGATRVKRWSPKRLDETTFRIMRVGPGLSIQVGEPLLTPIRKQCV